MRMDPRRAGIAESQIAHTWDEARKRWNWLDCQRSSGRLSRLGGQGGGIAYNRDEFEQIVRGGLDASPTSQVLVEEALLGWKEFEMEVVRDTPTTASSSVPSKTSILWASTPAIL